MKRPVRIEGFVAYLPLTQGFTATIDVPDVPLVEGRNWSALVSPKRRAVYAVRVETVASKQTMILLHRLLLNAPRHLHVDHIDLNGLNCQRANLRLCSQAENNRNTGLRADNTSGFKGVSWDKRATRWKAEIEGRFLGYYASAKQASDAYRVAAVEKFGPFARLA